MLEILYESALVLNEPRRNVPMPRAEVTIKTHDGNCPASFFYPCEWKGALARGDFLYGRFLGIRPVMWEMGQRLADGGYLVLQPDLYYRFGSYPPRVASEVLDNPKSMEEVMKWANSLDRDRKVSDSRAFLEFLSSRPDVKGNDSAPPAIVWAATPA
jgi:carboxymethylenebutenolidase